MVIYKNYNSNKLKKFPLSAPCSYVIPLSGVKVNKINLLLYKPKKAIDGSLKIFIVIDREKKCIEYSISLENIYNNQTLILDLGKSYPIEQSISIVIQPRYNNPENFVFIWVTKDHPCVIIHGVSYTKLKYEPVISLILPVYKPEPRHIKEAIDSVIAQAYPHWELCIVDDGSQDPVLKKHLLKLKSDNIKVKILNKNRGISGASNEAIKLASGKYIGLLDQDDLLDPEALLNVALTLNKKKKLKFIYTDEDKLKDSQNIYYDHFYKPNWSYDMYLCQNYTCHFSVFDRELINKIKGFNSEYNGSQDYDLTLRVIENIKENEIYHIPKILYHWRAHTGSAALSVTNKTYAHLNALKAVKDHLSRKKENAIVKPGRGWSVQDVIYQNDCKKSVQIIILTKNNYTLLHSCLFTVMQSTYPNFTVTIVDHDNTDEKVLRLFNELQKDERITIKKYKGEFNFSKMNNRAVDNKSDIYLFLNDDTEVVTENWIQLLSQHIEKNNVAIAGAKLLYPDNTIQHAGVLLGIGGIAGHSHKHLSDNAPGYFYRCHIIQNLSAVTGACLMINRKVFEQIDGFDEKLSTAFNDVDLCLKVRKLGYKITYNPNAILYHHESISRGVDPNEAVHVKYMIDKWKANTFIDPYYNINLSVTREDFSMKSLLK